MSRSGYALLQDDTRTLAAAVTATAPQRWRLTHWQDLAPGARPTGAVARELGRHGDRLAALVPATDVDCTVTTLPRLTGRELARAATGWVARKEGGTPEDWRVCWQALPAERPDASTQDVFLAYAPRPSVQAVQARAHAVGARPGIMLPPSLVLDQFFRLAGPDREGLRVWNLVFLGQEQSFLCVASERCLLLSRPLPRGATAGADKAEHLDRLVTEVERSVFFARQSAGTPTVDRLVVCGEPELAAQLVTRLQEGEHPAVRWDLGAVLDPGDHDLTADDQLLVAAAVLAAGRPTVNLAPPRRRQLLGAGGRRRLQLALATAAVAAVPVITGGSLLTDRVQERYLEDAQARLGRATERAEEAATYYARQRVLQRRQDILTSYVQERPDLAGVLRRIARLTPPEIRYRDLQVARRAGGLRLFLTGESAAASLAAAQRAFMTFHADLARAPQLEPRGEPRQLEIRDVDGQGRPRRAVHFALDFDLVTPPGPKDG
jgi:hypothetical protein